MAEDSQAMVRVVYRWKVRPEDRQAFTSTWADATDDFQSGGAQAVHLMRSQQDAAVFAAIVDWPTAETWQAFLRQIRRSTPRGLRALTHLGELIAADSFEDVQVVRAPN